MEQEQAVKKLVVRAVAEQAGAFEALYEHLVDKVFAYVKYRTFREEDALDLTQEIFIDLYKALPSFKYESTPQFYSFVFVITKRKLLSGTLKLKRTSTHRLWLSTKSISQSRIMIRLLKMKCIEHWLS